MPKIGDKAPDIEAETYGGKRIRLSDFKNKKTVVLYFYPKDNTPGCTKEACSMRDRAEEFEKLGVQILGVSTDSVKSHEGFRDRYNLVFPLLSDKERNIIKAYGVESDHGSARRVTFLIDKSGVIRYIWHKVDTSRHAEEVIEKIKELGL
ncbi:MAG TPA: peroxiredoxin [Thermodesulfobacteriota bacterium]|jgi:peroxiredoxin Q/BCP|nr:peroxiredoxin [Thermodesulfobacteriota bacterium]